MQAGQMKTRNRETWRRVRVVTMFVMLFVLWELAVRGFAVPAFILPPPSTVFLKMFEIRSQLLSNMWVTLGEALLGFGLSVAMGITLGALMVHFRWVSDTLYPLMIIKQVTPTIVFAPLIVIWMGTGMASKVSMAFLVAFFPMVVNTIAGLSRVDEDLVLLMRGLKASRWRTFIMIRLPSALPVIFAGMKVSITFSVLGAVVAEFISSGEGLGYLVNAGSAVMDTPLVFAAVMMLSLMGVVLFSALALAQKLFVPWAGNQVEAQA